MKKIILLLMILLLVGCGNNNVVPVDYSINKSYYDVYEDYKPSIDNNYIVNNVNSKYDLEEVELGLMRIASKYFSSSKYYYQSGQYINKDKMKELLGVLNSNNPEIINDINIIPKYISYIYEQNYLNNIGKTAGIVLAMVLNPYQSYTSNGITKYVKQDEEKVINYAKKKAQVLLDELKKIDDLKDKEIIIALYLQNSTDSLIPGNYCYEAKASNFKIQDFNRINEKYYLLPSEDLMKTDEELYNSYMNVENKIINLLPDYTAIIGKALYINNECREININIHINSAHKGDILAVSQEVAKEIVNNFDARIYTQVNVESNTEIEALIVRTTNSFNPRIYILD
jgi:protein involved in sex pheromone biosynthesis